MIFVDKLINIDDLRDREQQIIFCPNQASIEILVCQSIVQIGQTEWIPLGSSMLCLSSDMDSFYLP